MIRREHIKQAIDAISRRDPEIGYSLDELFGMGLIDAPELNASSEDANFHFLFEGQRVLVNRVLFFQQGTAPMEQGLLIKYGELVKRQEIQDRGEAPDYPAALREIHEAGLRLAVRYELDYAVSRLKKGVSSNAGHEEREGTALMSFLERIKREDAVLSIQEGSSDPPYLYKGALEGGAPALFMCFPFCMGSLMQVADLNMEFFHVRFLLTCLVRGLERNLLACVVQDRIVGLVFLALKERFLRSELEIKYIATRRRNAQETEEPSSRPPRGVGAFLVAGVWMLAKNEMGRSMDIVLDAEVGARGFYETLGFESRGFSGFVLRRPRPHLLRPLLSMARSLPELRPGAVHEIASMIKRHVKGLRRRPVTERGLSERRVAIASIQECLMDDTRPEFMDAALEGLLRYRKKILESADLLRHASEHGLDRVKGHVHAAGTSG